MDERHFKLITCRVFLFLLCANEPAEGRQYFGGDHKQRPVKKPANSQTKLTLQNLSRCTTNTQKILPKGHRNRQRPTYDGRKMYTKTAATSSSTSSIKRFTGGALILLYVVCGAPVASVNAQQTAFQSDAFQNSYMVRTPSSSQTFTRYFGGGRPQQQQQLLQAHQGDASQQQQYQYYYAQQLQQQHQQQQQQQQQVHFTIFI